MGTAICTPRHCEGRKPGDGEVILLGHTPQHANCDAFPPATNVMKRVQGSLHWVQNGGMGSMIGNMARFFSITSLGQSFQIEALLRMDWL